MAWPERVIFIVQAGVFGLAVAAGNPPVAAVSACFLAYDILNLLTKEAPRG